MTAHHGDDLIETVLMRLTRGSSLKGYAGFESISNDRGYKIARPLIYLTKTEIEEDGILHCPISLKRQTLWFSDTVNVIEASATVENGKEYPLQRPYAYGSIGYGNIQMLNDGMTEAPILIEVEGDVTDLQYSLAQDGEVYGRGKILGSYDYVSINSDDLNENITLKVDGSNIPNAVNYQDLTVGSPNEIYVTFLKLKSGVSTLRFTLGDGFDGKVRVSWRNAYLSV